MTENTEKCIKNDAKAIVNELLKQQYTESYLKQMFDSRITDELKKYDQLDIRKIIEQRLCLTILSEVRETLQNELRRIKEEKEERETSQNEPRKTKEEEKDEDRLITFDWNVGSFVKHFSQTALQEAFKEFCDNYYTRSSFGEHRQRISLSRFFNHMSGLIWILSQFKEYRETWTTVYNEVIVNPSSANNCNAWWNAIFALSKISMDNPIPILKSSLLNHINAQTKGVIKIINNFKKSLGATDHFNIFNGIDDEQQWLTNEQHLLTLRHKFNVIFYLLNVNSDEILKKRSDDIGIKNIKKIICFLTNKFLEQDVSHSVVDVYVNAVWLCARLRFFSNSEDDTLQKVESAILKYINSPPKAVFFRLSYYTIQALRDNDDTLFLNTYIRILAEIYNSSETNNSKDEKLNYALLKELLFEGIGAIAPRKDDNNMPYIEIEFKKDEGKKASVKAVEHGNYGPGRLIDTLKVCLSNESDRNVIKAITNTIACLSNTNAYVDKETAERIDSKFNLLRSAPENGLIKPPKLPSDSKSRQPQTNKNWYDYPELYNKFSLAQDYQNLCFSLVEQYIRKVGIHKIPNKTIQKPIDLCSGTGRTAELIRFHLCDVIEGPIYLIDSNKSMKDYVDNNVNKKGKNELITIQHDITTEIPDNEEFKDLKSDLIISSYGFPTTFEHSKVDSIITSLKNINKLLNCDQSLFITFGRNELFNDELSRLWYVYLHDSYSLSNEMQESYPYLRSYEEYQRIRVMQAEQLRKKSGIDFEWYKTDIAVQLRFKDLEESVDVMGKLFGRDIIEPILSQNKTSWQIYAGIITATKEEIESRIKQLENKQPNSDNRKNKGTIIDSINM